MRHGASGRRSRNRSGGRGRGGGGGGGGNHSHNRSHVYDSNGPDVRIRGTAYQIHEKYMALAKDAAGTGDRILEESYLQHAEHYQRIINSWIEASGEDRRPAHGDANAQENSGENREFRQQSKRQDEGLGLPASILGQARETEKAEADKTELQDA